MDLRYSILNLLELFNKLFEYFGPQGWWPTTKPGNILPTYHLEKHSPTSLNEKIEICIGAILTQNTNWKNVEKAIKNLNEYQLLDFKKLEKISTMKLANLIRPAGYYNQKAKKIKNFVFYIKKFGGLEKLFKLQLPTLRKRLLSINGIGYETADSIILYAAEKPIFVIDAYTKRITKRLGLFETDDYEKLRIFFETNLPKNVKIYSEFHALLVKHAKIFCKKQPDCVNCILKSSCKFTK